METLESRTLLSSGFGTMAEALFATSYASLHLRPVMTMERAPRQGAAPAGATTRDATTAVYSQPVVEQAAPPAFVGALQVDVDPDGTSATFIEFQAGTPGTFAAVGRWDGGPAEILLVDQPGASGYEPGVGGVYAMRERMPAGQHTLENTVTNVARNVSASAMASFEVGATPEVSPSPTLPGSDFDEGVPAPDSASFSSTAPTVTGVFADSTAWVPAFRSYLAANSLGDAGFLIPGGSGQLLELPWVNVNRVSVRFSESVVVARGDLMVSGASVTTYGYAAGGFSYDAATFTATWTLNRDVGPEKLRLQLRNEVRDASGERLDGEWTDASSVYNSGDGFAGGDFNFRLNVLPGDAVRGGRVNTIDINHVKARVGRSTIDPGPAGTAAYLAFDDVDGDGVITGEPGDVAFVKANVNNVTPGDEPLPPPNPAASIGDAPRTISYYLDDAWGQATQTRFDSRGSSWYTSPSAMRTYDPVPGPGAMTYTLLSNARNGGLEFAADGNWTYTPMFDKQGADRFRYNATDSANVSRPADVFIETTRQPVFANDDYETVGGGSEPFSYASVLRNDFGSPVLSLPSLTASASGSTERGASVTVSPDGTFVYTPPSGGLMGRDSFQYTLQESRTGKTATGKVVLDGEYPPGQTPPPAPYNYNRTSYGTAATGISHTTIHDRPVEVGGYYGLAELFSNAGSDAVYSATNSDKGGTVTVTDPVMGYFRYTPPQGFVGWDSFNAYVITAAGSAGPQKVFVLVTNRVPEAVSAEYYAPQGTPFSGMVDVIEQDGDAVTYRPAIQPAHGKLDLDENGSFTYTSDAGFLGVDAFTYFANGGIIDGGLATVYLNVEPRADVYVSIDAIDPVATEGANPADPGAFAITRTDTIGSLTVQYVIDASSTAAAGDYELVGAASFVAGQSQAVIEVRPVNDEVFELTETVVLRLKPGTGYSLYGSPTATVEIVDDDGLDLVAYRTGGKLGQAVTEQVEDTGDPAKYLVLTNNDFEEGVAGGGRDYANDSAAVAGDDDLAKITLKRLPPEISAGAVEIVLSDPGAVRLFKSDGSLLFKEGQTSTEALTLYLSNPTGYLAGLRSGDVDVWMEGLRKNADLRIAYVYRDATGAEVSRDEVHMTVAEWTFRNAAGVEAFEVTPVWKESLLAAVRRGSQASDGEQDAFYKIQIDGLAFGVQKQLNVMSDVDPADRYTDEADPIFSDKTVSKYYAVLYLSRPHSWYQADS